MSTIVFTLPGSGLPATLNTAMFSDVVFQYGTHTSDPA